MPAPDNITTLGPTASFYEWFQSYNNNAVGKLNKMYVYNIYAGNGIGITTDSLGGYTLSLASTITSGLTFTGNVFFNGGVSFNSSSVQIPNVSQGFSGNFTSSGLTIGRVVRVNTTGGLSLADASGRTAAEAIGVVTSFSTTSSTVCLIGKISGSTLTSNILESGGVFSTGCVYFLSQSIPGKVTTTEPSLNGKVSKPILIATSATDAMVIPFRGQYIDLVGACGASGSFNNLIVGIKSLGETEANYKLAPGSIMAFSASAITGVTLYQTADSPSLYYYKARDVENVNSMLGIVAGYAGATYSSTVDVINYMDVRPFASVVEFDSLGWDSSLKNVGFVYLDSNGDPTLVANTAGPIGIASGENFLFYPFIPQGSRKTPTLPATVYKAKNHLVNGSLEIWQRVGVGEVSGYTSSATGGYFADRWCFINENPGGQTLGIRRYAFTQSQVEVDGYPSYYFNIKGTTAGANKSFNIENRNQDSRTNAGKEMTLSFYAKNNGTGVTFTPYIRQYGSTYTSEQLTYNTTDIYITSSSWQRYYANMTIPYPTGNTFSTESFIGIGLRAKSKSFDVDFAQFIFEDGLTASDPEKVDADEEYKKCSYYYQRSYDRNTITGAHTIGYSNALSIDGAPGTPNLYYTTGEGAVGGGAVFFQVTEIARSYSHTLPVKMRPSSYFKERPEYYNSNGIEIPAEVTSYPIVKIFSPYTIPVTPENQPGSSEANMFNYTAGTNLTNTQGTYSILFILLSTYLGTSFDAAVNTRRIYPSGGIALKAGLVPNADGSASTITVKPYYGALPFDYLSYHYVIDLDLYQGLT